MARFSGHCLPSRLLLSPTKLNKIPFSVRKKQAASLQNTPCTRHSPQLVAGSPPHALYCHVINTRSQCGCWLCWHRCSSQHELQSVQRITTLHLQTNPNSTRKPLGSWHFAGLPHDLHAARRKYSRRIINPVYVQQHAWKS